jgi:hypothetical protein
MQKRMLLLVFVISFTLILHGQGKNDFWERLKNDSSENIIITPGPEFPETDWDSTLKPKFALPLKAGTNVFAWVGGTGRLYKMEADVSSGYRFKRIDSTEALLYNINAFPFAYKNRIYTLGGGGIWRTNGQLRIYNETAHEWDIVKLNKEIPFLWSKEDGSIWYNPKAGKIYIGFYSPFNEAVKEESKPVAEVYELNLKTKEWSKLGDLNPEFVKHINKFRNIAMSPNGLLCLLDSRIYLFNFEKNKVYRLRDNTPYWQLLNRWFDGSTFYFKDSVLYAHNASKNLFDSVRMRMADFETATVPVYKKQRSSFFYFSLLLPIFLGFIAFIVLRKRKTAIKSDEAENSPEQVENIKLSVSEGGVLKLIFTNSMGGNKTTIEELNMLMGLHQKNVDIQKKQRSDMLLSLNRKLSNLSENEKPVIDKVRSETDKRVFEYYIDPSLFDKVNVVLGAAASS